MVRKWKDTSKVTEVCSSTMYIIYVYLCTGGFTDDALKLTRNHHGDSQTPDAVKDRQVKCFMQKTVFVY